MNIFLVFMVLYAGQMNTLQSKPVVHLQPHHAVIDAALGGKLLELIDAPTLVNLPVIPPKHDFQGDPWSLDVRNLGPGVVTVVGEPQFSTKISVNQTVHISSTGTRYLQSW